MQYSHEAIRELNELNKILNLDEDVLCQAQIYIDSLGNSHNHMKIYEFVDMCLDMARI